MRLATLVLGSVLLLAGCSGGVNVAEIDARSKRFELVRTDNSSLERNAPIIAGRAAYQGEVLQAFVEIESHDSSPQKLYYRFTWFDDGGFNLPEEPWQWLFLEGHQRRTVTGSASAPKAVRCLFELRRPASDEREN